MPKSNSDVSTALLQSPLFCTVFLSIFKVSRPAVMLFKRLLAAASAEPQRVVHVLSRLHLRLHLRHLQGEPPCCHICHTWFVLVLQPNGGSNLHLQFPE
jgi:hypothetical protein